MKQRIAVVAVSALTAGLFTVVSTPAANANTALVLGAPGASIAGTATSINLLGSQNASTPLSDAQAELIKIIPGSLVQPTSGGLSENASFGGSAVTTTGSEPYQTAQVLAITPGAAGSYSMRMYADLNSDGVVGSSEPQGTVSWVTGGTATQLIASQSVVTANTGARVTVTLTALDALNRKTLIATGATEQAASTSEVLASETGTIAVGVNASATAETLLAADGGRTGVTNRNATRAQLTAAADADGFVETGTALPFAGVTNYIFGEAGTYTPTQSNGTLVQIASGTYIASEGTYKFVVNTTGATGTITVQAAFGTTAADGAFTATATATSLSITLATVTAPADAETLGISSSQTLTDATSSTTAVTASASLTTVKTASLTVDVAQPTVNFTLSKAASTATFGIFVVRNATYADNGSTNKGAAATASTVNVIPTADLTQGFRRVTLADGTTTFAVTNLTPAAGEKYSVVLVDSAVTPATDSGNSYALINVTYAAPATSTTNSSVNPPAATVKFGDPITMTVKVRDQFDNPIVNRVISYTVAGRNPVTTAVEATTDASGNATFTLADTAATTAAGTSTVTVELNPKVAAGTIETAILTYNAVGSVVASVTLADNQASDAVIEYDSKPTNGTSSVTYTATVLDANGLGLPGIPVTLNVPTGVTVYADDAASGTTDASGQYAVRVSSNLAATYSFTATSGGKTSSAATQKWTQGAVSATGAPATARTLVLSSTSPSALAEGIIQMIAKVTDRHGNPVANVQVTLTENGVGRFLVQSGSNSSVTAYTDSAGVVTADITSTSAESGTNRVVASFTGSFNNAGTATAITSPQYLDLAGFVGSGVVSGVVAGNETSAATVTFGGGTATVSNADVLKAIVSLIASINKQIAALQKALLRR
jgi:hypothetical protein